MGSHPRLDLHFFPYEGKREFFHLFKFMCISVLLKLSVQALLFVVNILDIF